jgi:hypothetical protein
MAEWIKEWFEVLGAFLHGVELDPTVVFPSQKQMARWMHPGWTGYPIGGGIGPVLPFYPAGGEYGGRGGKGHPSAAQVQQLVNTLRVVLHHLWNAMGGRDGGSGRGALPTEAAQHVVLRGRRYPAEWAALRR